MPPDQKIKTSVDMEYVVIARYSFAHEARIALSTLQAAGISAYLSDENIVQNNWLYSNAIGGVKLHVQQSNVENALEVLATDYSASLEEELKAEESTPYEVHEDANGKTLICPQCNSTQIEYVVKGKKEVFLSIVLLGAPIIPFSRGYHCHSCGHFWKAY